MIQSHYHSTTYIDKYVSMLLHSKDFVIPISFSSVIIRYEICNVDVKYELDNTNSRLIAYGESLTLRR